MALKDFEAFLATPGQKTDAEVVAAMAAAKVGAADVAKLTNLPVADINARVNSVLQNQFTQYLGTPNLTDAQILDKANELGIGASQIAAITNLSQDEISRRMKAVATANANAEAARLAALNGTATTTTNTNNYDTFQNWLKTTPNLTDSQIAAEMLRLGITTGQVGQITGLLGTDIENRFRATTPFAGATQGFAQNFNNYQSIPIGSQYNPFAVGGSGSPYAQIMGQMKPVGNPYQNVVSNLPMGGYNPGLYDQIAAANAAKAKTSIAGNVVGGDGGVDNGDGGAAAVAAANAAANAANAAAAVTGESVSVSGETGESVSGIYNKGGMVDGLFGMNPPGPDDGAGYLDKGEYVIKKSAVNKYGKGLLDMINEGKVPAKKMKSLLG